MLLTIIIFTDNRGPAGFGARQPVQLQSGVWALLDQCGGCVRCWGLQARSVTGCLGHQRGAAGSSSGGQIPDER